MTSGRKIGILTGGGDCPGLNAVIRAVVKAAARLGWDVAGVRRGFEGLLPPGDIVPVPIRDAIGKIRSVPPDGNVVQTARALGISFGAPEDA